MYPPARVLLCLIVTLGAAAPEATLHRQAPDWPQWGGPGRDFTVDSGALAEGWPNDGPREIWRRPFPAGYSALTIVDGMIFTMAGDTGRERVIALSAETGETIWEHSYAVDTSILNPEYGPGPHATPLVVGERVFAVGGTGSLRALGRSSGELIWSVELWGELGGTHRGRGYSASPLAHGDTIVLPVGGPDRAVIAFDRADGSIRWSGGSEDAGHASPIVVDVEGREQIVALLAEVVIGVEPGSGRVLWRVEHAANQLNISTPVWHAAERLLFVSSAYGGGSRGLRLRTTPDDGGADELWHNPRMRVHIGSVVRIGGRVYGSSGDFGPAFMVGLDLDTGAVVWQDRTFAKAQLLAVDNRLLLLDEDGELALVEPGAGGMEVLGRTRIFDTVSWTPPTLMGTRLYARSRSEIVALDLG